MRDKGDSTIQDFKKLIRYWYICKWGRRRKWFTNGVPRGDSRIKRL